MSRPALFLDRDGVLNIDHGYVCRIADFEPTEGVFEALRKAADRSYALIVVTNQSGIGRGYFTQEDYDALEQHMRQLFAAEGVIFTAIYHCPHHPDADCECRKPKPGMFLKAAREHDIDMSQSAMIGDKASDAIAARAAGIRNIETITMANGAPDAINAILNKRENI